MIGTQSQIEWAEQIRPRVAAEFDRVARALKAVADNQTEPDQIYTHAVIAILEEKRIEVMSNEHAGYFIRNWQELSNQVQKMIIQDSRYQSIKAKRTAHQR